MKKILLTLSLFVAAMGTTYSQSTIWQPHNSNIDTTQGIRYISVVDSNIVWGINEDGTNTVRASGKFTRTIDGATFTSGTFLADTNHLNVSNISAVNGNTAFISLFNKDAAGSAGAIIKTVNGGTTWNFISDTTTMFIGANNFPDFVHFYNVTNGFALGDPNGNTGGGATNEFEIWRTHNGGTNWARVADANIPNPLSGEYGLTNCYTTLGNHIWYGTNKARVYRSSDSGQTWKVSGVIAGMAGGAQGLAFRDSLNGLCWGLSSTSGAHYILRKTTDGGVTWTNLYYRTNVGTNDICVIPGRNAYMSVGLDSASLASTGGIVGNGILTSVTYDDGATWNILESVPGGPNASKSYMLQVQMLDSLHGWAGNFSSDTLPLGTNGMNKYKGPKIALACPLNITATKTSICLNDSTTLTALGANTYTWSTSATTSSVTVHPTATTVYSVTGTAGSCVNTQTISITVAAVANPVVTVSNTNTVCTGSQIVLNAGGATTYSWVPSTSLSGSTGATVYAHPTTTTDYTVYGTSGICKSYNTFTVTVNPTPGPTVTVNSATLCPTVSSVTLTANGAVTYSWTPATGLSATSGASIAANPTVTTVYMVTGTTGLCMSTMPTTVTVSACTGINQISNNNKISIYPNPSTGLITINIPTVNEGTVMYVTDMIGKEVYKASINDNNTNFDLSGLQRGMYMISITSGKNIQVEKLIINN